MAKGEIGLSRKESAGAANTHRPMALGRRFMFEAEAP